jgi:sodium/potassium/calcium exchanger 6
MGMTVEDFLCPSLSSISNILRLSDNVAGVTFLAVGNGAADIFSIIILMIKVDRDGSYAETAMGSILGGGLFVVTVVAGAICFCYKLIVDPSIFIRDVGFYIAAVIWLSVMIADGRILLGEAIGFIILYVLYVVCVLFYNQREKRRQQNKERKPLLSHRDPETSSSAETTFTANNKADSSATEGERVARHDSASLPDGAGEVLEITSDDIVFSNSCYQWLELWKAIWPYSKAYLQKRWYSLVILVTQAPLRFFLTVTVPVVDCRTTPVKNWNRLLIICNILLGPAFATFAFEGFFHRLHSYVYVGIIVLGVSAIAGLAVFLTSHKPYPPKYQWVSPRSIHTLRQDHKGTCISGP